MGRRPCRRPRIPPRIPPRSGAGVSTGKWLPDGRLAFHTWEGPGRGGLYVVDPTLTTVDALMGGNGEPGIPFSPEVTPDGVHAVFTYLTGSRDGANGIYTALLDGMREPRPLIIDHPYPPMSPALSPDGRWLAYVAIPNAHVRRFSLDPDELGEPVVLPNVLGLNWSADGEELIYVQRETSDVMSVRVTAEPELAQSRPRTIVDYGALGAAKARESFVSIATFPDGRIVYVGGPRNGTDPPAHHAQR